MSEGVDGCTNGWMHGWMDGCIDGFKRGRDHLLSNLAVRVAEHQHQLLLPAVLRSHPGWNVRMSAHAACALWV